MNDHILELVLSHTSTGKDYKNYCLVNKAWYRITGKLFPGGDKFCNHLLTLLMKFPNGSLVGDLPTNEQPTNKPWNYTYLSLNPNITLEYIEANIDKNWDYHVLSYNNILTPKFVDKHPTKNWRYSVILRKSNFSWDFISKNIDKCANGNIYVSGNANVTWNIIQDNPNVNWDYSELSENPNITWEIIRDNLNINWDYAKLSAHPNITWEIIRDNLNINWDYAKLSVHPNITWEIVRDNLDLPWNFQYMIGHNPNITWENIQIIPYTNNIRIFCRNNYNAVVNIEKYENLIDYDALSDNIKLTEKYIIDHLDKPWNYEKLSYHLSVSWDLLSLTLDKPWIYRYLEYKITIKPENFNIIINRFNNYKDLSESAIYDCILEFPDKPWDYEELSCNLNIPLDFIFNNPDRKWDYSNVSSRSDLTWRDVVNHPETPWDFTQLSRNYFSK